MAKKARRNSNARSTAGTTTRKRTVQAGRQSSPARTTLDASTAAQRAAVLRGMRRVLRGNGIIGDIAEVLRYQPNPVRHRVSPGPDPSSHLRPAVQCTLKCTSECC